MAELEIHHETGHEHDPTGKKIGILAAVLAVLLCIVTISSHRSHTAAIVAKTEANDQWNFYQAKRLKSHNLQLGEDLVKALGAKNEAGEKMVAKYSAEIERYEREGKEIQEKAEEKEGESHQAENQALRFDLGEGLLEIALVLTSLYFISKRMFFPIIGVVCGLTGTVIAATGYLMK
jgi:hypothetical protein